MAFIDELKINIKAGKGGDGVVRWLHEKGKEFSGPAGGNGGRGGDVYIEGVQDIGLLFKYRHVKEFEAENGEDGKGKSCFGKNGEDLIIKLPVGSIVTNLESGFSHELLETGQRIKILNGGRGGVGNEHFKSSTNINPFECTPGRAGEQADFEIELQIVADVGLVGLPNAGKSSLLNSVTRANAKVGSYAFTTLDPNLGALYEFIIADIPGLIEGASDGKGLGHKFLRHVKRTKLLAHCISIENEDVLKTYKIVREEIEKYNPEMADKPEIIIITKTDTSDPETIEKAREILSQTGREVLELSIIDDNSIKVFTDNLIKTLRK